jgi:hypothetical protein
MPDGADMDPKTHAQYLLYRKVFFAEKKKKFNLKVWMKSVLYKFFKK